MIIDCKKNIYANIKEQNIINFVPAGQIQHCFSVTFIRETIYTLFGKVIKKTTKSETMPFSFKSFDVAKDFCEICPIVISDVFVNSEDYNHVKYYTYRLVKNDKILGYIKWDRFYTCSNISDICTGEDKDILFTSFLNDKIVGSFVKDIIVKSWVETDSLDNVTFIKPKEYLSQLITVKQEYKEKETYKEWNFKLVEQ